MHWDEKLPLKGEWSRSCDLFLNFGASVMSLERVKLGISNSLHWLILMSTSAYIALYMTDHARKICI